MHVKNEDGPRVALIAHDNKKADLIDFVHKHSDHLANFRLVATQATGKVIQDRTAFEVRCVLPGPLGGDLQIGSEIASGRIDALIFLGDPLMAQKYEPDFSTLIRVCDIHKVPVATNLATAEILLHGLFKEGSEPSP